MQAQTSGPRVPDLNAYLGEYDPFGLQPQSVKWEASGVGWIVAAGSDLATSEAAVDAAWSLQNTIAGVGLGPGRFSANDAGSAAALEELSELAELASDPQVAVISDVGVDQTVEAPLSLQMDVLRALLDIAKENSRSVLLHWNAPLVELLDFWDGYDRPPRAAILGFHGEAEQAQELIARSFYFSVSPAAVGLSSSASTTEDVLGMLPAERLFVHSSARPSNGKPAVDPPIIHDVLDRLAAARAVPTDELASQINHNLWEFLTWRPK